MHFYHLLFATLATSVTSQFTLQLLSEAAYPQAKCLDGSMGGYYYSPGIGADASHILLHTQGVRDFVFNRSNIPNTITDCILSQIKR